MGHLASHRLDVTSVIVFTKIQWKNLQVRYVYCSYVFCYYNVILEKQFSTLHRKTLVKAKNCSTYN